MKINLRESALKDLKKIDKMDKSRIHQKILELEHFPNTTNVKKLANFKPAYRVRVGDYRILFDVVGDTIEIGRILSRQASYKN